MKCVVQGNSESCRRCHRARLPCIFVPRANAAQLPELGTGQLDSDFKQSVLQRLAFLEDRVGFLDQQGPASARLSTGDMSISIRSQPPGTLADGPLWTAIGALQDSCPAVPSMLWLQPTVESLWSSYVPTKLRNSILCVAHS